jgi:hypothetical protein
MADIFAGIYSHRSMILIPTTARTGDGFYIEVEPVEVLDTPTTDALEAALARVFSRGTPTIPTPPPGHFPKPVLLGYAKARTWSDFERSARLWQVEQNGEAISITPTKRAKEGGFLDVSQKRELFTGESLRPIAERLIQLVAQAAP